MGLPQFGEIWLSLCNLSINMKLRKEFGKKKKGESALQEWLCNRKLLNNSADKVWTGEEFIFLSQSSAGMTAV